MNENTKYEDPRRTQAPEYPEDKIPEKDPDAEYDNYDTDP